MSSVEKPRIGEVLPSEAWKVLQEDPDAVLIDVRTRAEWNYVGIPDLGEMTNPFLLVEWQQWPDLKQNPAFVDMVMEQLWGRTPRVLFFLCRSGVRSLQAAEAVAAHLREIGQEGACVNVLGGFEGDKDELRQRGKKNGWKAAGLPWRQG